MGHVCFRRRTPGMSRTLLRVGSMPLFGSYVAAQLFNGKNCYKLPSSRAYCLGSSLGGNLTASAHGGLWRRWARRLWGHQRGKRYPDTGAHALPIAIREMADKHRVGRGRQCSEKTAKD
jgi:hypothetical protein